VRKNDNLVSLLFETLTKLNYESGLTFFLQKNVIVIYITNAVGYILQREDFRLKHDPEAGVF
jgi:hypothetical protein